MYVYIYIYTAEKCGLLMEASRGEYRLFFSQPSTSTNNVDYF